MHVWTPKPSATTQNDATYLVSPGNYEQFVLPFERQMSKSVTCLVYHCHNTSTHILPSVACISELMAIQMTVDPNGPPWENQRQAIAQLQENKPVVLSFWSISDADRAIKELNPRGLAITLNVKVKDEDPGDISLEEYIG